MLKRLAERFLVMRGWEFVGDLPAEDKFIIVGAPHTSNWDFILALGWMSHYGTDIQFLAKDGLFRGPFGSFFRRLGGIPVDRNDPGSMVDQVVAAFDGADHMILAIAPEGTRAAAAFWRSGFLRIARAGGIPMLLVAVDGDNKQLVMGPLLDPATPTEDTMETIRGFFAGRVGIRRGGESTVRLRSEVATD